MSGMGDITLDGKKYRIDISSWKEKDIIDFAPRATVPGGAVVMSDLGLYQPLLQTNFQHGFGFQWYEDAQGYLSTTGNIDTRQDGLAMLFTKSNSSDTDNNRKDGIVTFGSAAYSYGVGGIRKYSSATWSAVSIMKVGTGTAVEGSAAASSITLSVTISNASNRCLFVSIHTKTNVTISSITYGGVAMTAHSSLGTAPKVFLYKLVAPAVGTANLVVTLSGSDNVVVHALPLYNVDQTTPLSSAVDTSTASGTSSSGNVTSAERKLVLNAITLNAATTPVVSASDTLVNTENKTNMSGSLEKQAGATSVTTAWSWTGATKAEQEAVSVNVVAEQTVNFLLPAGDYLFAFPDGARAMKSTDGSTWTEAGVDSGATDYKWAIIHNGIIYVGKDGTNQIHTDTNADLSQLEGTTVDTDIIYCGIGNIPTIGAIVFQGNLYVARQDGLWLLGEDRIARRVIDHSTEASSTNFRGMAVVNGYLFYSMRDKVKQWNGARVQDVTPPRITDTFPYVTYGQFDNFLSFGDFLYITGRTNETTYLEAILAWDGVGWHKLSDLITNGTDTTSMLSFDVINNYIWYHVDATADATYYIPVQDRSVFPYASFPTTGTHSLITSRLDMGFRRIKKSMPSLLVEARNCSSARYIKIYYQIDGDGTWIHWEDIKQSGVIEITDPGSNKTREFNYLLLRFDFITDSADQSPILESYTMRFIMRPNVLYGYSFYIISGTELMDGNRIDERGSKEIRKDLMNTRNSKAPVTLTDFAGYSHVGYVTSIQGQPAVRHFVEDEEPEDMEMRYLVNFASLEEETNAG